MAIRIKTEEQLEGIRQSSKIAAQTLKFIEPYVKPGVTTGKLNDLCETFMRDHGAVPATLNYRGYPKASCISINDVICHGIPGKYELKDGDILNIDVTTILNKYFGDTSKMFVAGEASAEAMRLITTTKECLRIGIEQSYAGNRLGNIGYEIAKYAHAEGYSVVFEFCGHGVGVKFHEDPEVPHIADKNTGPILKKGMVFTIEPMINQGKARAKIDKRDGWTARTIDGKLSAQFEHTIGITDGKPEIFTDLDGEY